MMLRMNRIFVLSCIVVVVAAAVVWNNNNNFIFATAAAEQQVQETDINIDGTTTNTADSSSVGSTVKVESVTEETTTTSISSSSRTQPQVQLQQQQVQPHDIPSIIPLYDHDFEHETQASTGQTTGSWLIWFYNKTMIMSGTDRSLRMETNSNKNITFMNTFPNIDIWQEQYINVAKVNVGIPQGIVLQKRFIGTLDKYTNKYVPSFIYIHQKYMYRILPQIVIDTTTNTKSYIYDWDIIYQYCLNPTKYIEDIHHTKYIVQSIVPPPATWLDDLIDKLANNPSFLSLFAVSIMIIGAIGGTLIDYISSSKSINPKQQRVKRD